MRRTSTLAASLTLLAITLFGSLGARAADLQEGKIRVLILTGGHGFQSKPFYQVFDGIDDVEYDKAEFPAAADLLKPELADKYDVIVFYDMFQGLTPEQQANFVKLAERGIGLFPMHHTLGAHRTWPEYMKMIGGKYHLKAETIDGKQAGPSNYAHGQDLKIHVCSPDHPITRGLADFEIHDETYGNCSVTSDVTLLLSTDHPKNNRQIAWVKHYANSRVFYLQLGHDAKAFANPHFIELVARGIRWTAGRPADPTAQARALFNGADLAGWENVGGSRWEVKDGILIGRQGPDNAPGDLLSKESFGDFELSVTFRMVWPANSGIWYRYQSPEKTFQADILEYKKPFALTGTLYCPGKMFIATNTDASIINREGWNTMVIRAAGTRQVIFLNGTKVADVRDDTTATGRVGFQIHAGAQFGKMEIQVKEMTIREL